MTKKTTILLILILLSGDIIAEQRLYQRSTEYCPMRDSIQLATEIYKPLFGYSWPAVLIRTPYGREGFTFAGVDITTILPTLLQIVMVVQDTRGRGDSQGIDSVFLDNGWGDRQDGYDAVEWTAAQSWCNGKVTLLGASAHGINAYHGAGALPPHLKSVIALVATSNLYAQAAYQQGAFREELTQGWLESTNAFHMMPVVTGHPLYDQLWLENNFETRIPLLDLPILHIGGWYDCFSLGTIRSFQLMKQQAGASSRDHQYLLMGPWTHHETLQSTRIGDLNFPNIADFNALSMLIDFISATLKNDNSVMNPYAPVNYFLMEAPSNSNQVGNQWLSAESWPPNQDDSLILYLNPDSSLNQRANLNPASVSWISDPTDPIPTKGGNNLNISAGPVNQSDLLARTDILRFSTDTLTRHIKIAGSVKTVVRFQTDAPDIDLCVKLNDVWPDGRVYNILDGIAKARYHLSFESEQLLQPDSVYTLIIDLWPTAYVFAPGHRLQLDISGSNSPRFQVNRQNGDAVFDTIQPTRIANVEIMTGGNSASYLILPLLEPLAVEITEPSVQSTPSLRLFSPYPNPGTRALIIPYLLNQSLNAGLKIYDIEGRLVKNLTPLLKPGIQTLFIDTQHLPSGTYFICLNDQFHSKTVQWTKIK